MHKEINPKKKKKNELYIKKNKMYSIQPFWTDMVVPAHSHTPREHGYVISQSGGGL